MRLLLIEDSASLRKSLGLGLQKLGNSVDATGDGAEGLNMALQGDYDLLILDLMLPTMDGIAILKTLRQQRQHMRVLILSARSEPEDKTRGILAGADDYLAKPFSFDELHARLLNLMRRAKSIEHCNHITIGACELDLQLKVLSVAGMTIALTPNEYKIVECLFLNRNKLVTSEKLSESIIGSFDSISKNSIEAHLSAVRKKVRSAGADLPVKNKRGFGYLVTDDI